MNDTTEDTRPFVPTEDGETVELPDGRALRLKIEPDEGMTIEDVGGDWFGQLAWVEHDRDTGNDRPRPDGFDGRARKLWTRGDAFWWQPPADVTDRDLLATMARQVADIMEYGYSVVVVELLAPASEADFYGRRPVLDVAAMGGVEPFADAAYIQEVVEELVTELLGDDAGELVRNC